MHRPRFPVQTRNAWCWATLALVMLAVAPVTLVGQPVELLRAQVAGAAASDDVEDDGDGCEEVAAERCSVRSVRARAREAGCRSALPPHAVGIDRPVRPPLAAGLALRVWFARVSARNGDDPGGAAGRSSSVAA
jgi:hypothetical protein